MKSLRFLDRRLGFSLGSLGLLLGMVAPAVVPAFTSAAQVATRSIAMSTTAKSATAEYTVTFTPATAEASGAVDLFFCNDSPIPGQTCTAPSGFSVASATLGTGTTSGASIISKAANKIEVDVALSTTPVVLVLSGVTNPDYVTTTSTNQGFYGRIQTYASEADATAAYGNTGSDNYAGALVDQGGVALAVTDTIGVSAAVRETMTFCVFGATDPGDSSDFAPAGECDDTGNSTSAALPASMTLGEGTPKALSTSAVSTGSDYAQISTNAANGAIVYLKNSNSCGGLMRAGAAGCDIAAVDGGTALTAGIPEFGVQLGTPTAATGGTTPSGTLTPNSAYTSAYNLLTSDSTSSAAGDPSAPAGGLVQDVTSTYGGYLFGTNHAPIANQNIKLTFGASASNVTPAGQYHADISLIAVGTF